jgi:hypothetical protein
MVVLAVAVFAGILAAPAAAQFMGVGPLIVHDFGNEIHFIATVTQGAQQVAQGLQNLARLPQTTIGNIRSEVGSVASQAQNIPTQVTGTVAAARVLQNLPIDTARSAQIDQSAAAANGAQQQAQVENQYLSQLNSTEQQRNALDAKKQVQEAAATADQANILLSISGAGKN